MSPPNIPLLDHRRLRWVPLLLCLWLSGCASYYGQLLQGQVQLLRQREPIDAVLADPARDAHLRQRLALSQQARRFASAALQLPDNRSYRVYADIGRPFVVWNVFATPRYSLAPLEHCFPIAGCVAYRGYYQQGRARGAAALLNEEGLDTYVGGVEAYSTLGWFDDPLLSSMLRWDDDRLAATIFHELAHQRFYLPGDTAFNESYASFVEQQGLREWRASRGLPAPDAAAQAQAREFTERVLETRRRLERLYASGLEPAQMELGKQAEFERLRRDYAVLREREWHGSKRFDAWVYGPLNNAKLLPFGLYDTWVPAFTALFAEQKGEWAAFYRAVERLGALPASARHDALDGLLAR
jgi:predicted aminopeptidase